MTMKRLNGLAVVGAAVTGSLITSALFHLAPNAVAQSSPNKVLAQSEVVAEAPTDVIDLEVVTCRDLLRSEGEDRANTLVFMHGYINGQNANLKIDGPAIADTTNQIVDACIDDADKQLLAVFTEYR